MSIQDRLEDAALLWSKGRREGAFSSVLVAAAATARKTFPENKSDREAFEAFMKTTHSWTIEIEHRGKLVDVDRLPAWSGVGDRAAPPRPPPRRCLPMTSGSRRRTPPSGSTTTPRPVPGSGGAVGDRR